MKAGSNVNDTPAKPYNYAAISLVPLPYILQEHVNTTLALIWDLTSSGYQRLLSRLAPKVYRIWLNISCSWNRSISECLVLCDSWVQLSRSILDFLLLSYSLIMKIYICCNTYKLISHTRKMSSNLQIHWFIQTYNALMI